MRQWLTKGEHMIFYVIFATLFVMSLAAIAYRVADPADPTGSAARPVDSVELSEIVTETAA